MERASQPQDVVFIICESREHPNQRYIQPVPQMIYIFALGFLFFLFFFKVTLWQRVGRDATAEQASKWNQE
jgi:thiosulfate reductase cytochrome b subunit